MKNRTKTKYVGSELEIYKHNTCIFLNSEIPDGLFWYIRLRLSDNGRREMDDMLRACKREIQMNILNA